jgi:hypothetical protein
VRFWEIDFRGFEIPLTRVEESEMLGKRGLFCSCFVAMMVDGWKEVMSEVKAVFLGFFFGLKLPHMTRGVSQTSQQVKVIIPVSTGISPLPMTYRNMPISRFLPCLLKSD